MSMKETLSTISIETVINDLRNFATITGILGGVCYFIGYLTMNFYLSRFGAHYASLVQARYFTTGFLFIIISALTATGPIAIWGLMQTGNYGNFKKFLFLVSGVMMSAITIWGLGYFLVSFPFVKFGRPFYPAETRRVIFLLSFTGSQILLWCPVFFMLILRNMEKHLKIREGETNTTSIFGSVPTIRTALSSFVIVLFLLLSIYSYAIQAYPQIPTTFGGGAPKEVRLLLSDPSAINGLSIAVNGQLSEPVLLLDQTDRTFFIMDIQNSETLELSSSLVSAVVHEK